MELSRINRPKLPFFEEPDYSLFESKLETVKDMLRICNENLLILDYYKGDYAYVSAKEYLYCGYTKPEMMKLGNNFIQKIAVEEDKPFLEQIQDLTINFIHALPPKRRNKFTLFMTHGVKDKLGSVFSIDIKLTPFLFNKDGYIWMMLCTASFSPKTQQKRAYIEMLDTMERLEYSLTKNSFAPTKPESLTEKEKMVLIMTSRGYTEMETANKLHVSVNTVKSHKRNIYQKTHTANFSEAFVYAATHRMI